MKKRSWWCYVFGVLVSLLIAAALWFLSKPRPRLSAAVFNKIAIGMTVADVERFVNAPPGDYSGGRRGYNRICVQKQGEGFEMLCTATISLPLAKMRANPDEKFVAWWGRNRVLLVVTDANGIVTQLLYGIRTVPPNDWLGRCRFWIDSWFEERD